MDAYLEIFVESGRDIIALAMFLRQIDRVGKAHAVPGILQTVAL